jgi:WD40 repeat protein
LNLSADSALILPPVLPQADGTIGLVNVSNGALTRLSTRGHPVSWAAYRPDGRRIATVGLDGSVQLWDVKTAKMIADRPGRRPWAQSGFPLSTPSAIAFTPDGTRIVVADPAGRVTELDARTLEPTDRSMDLPMAPLDIQATRGGMVAATSAWDLPERADVWFADSTRDGSSIGCHSRTPTFSCCNPSVAITQSRCTGSRDHDGVSPGLCGRWPASGSRRARVPAACFIATSELALSARRGQLLRQSGTY